MATTTTKDKGPARYLRISEERTNNWGEHYFHLKLRVCTREYEGTGEDYHARPVGMGDSSAYDDSPRYSHLRLSCQGDERSRQREALEDGGAVYAFRTEYEDVHTVDLREARRMAKTLEKVERTLRKLRETRGHVGSYGDYCGRVAEALGCVGMVEERSEPAYNGNRYTWHTIGDGINAINHRIYRWQQEWKDLQKATQSREEAAS